MVYYHLFNAEASTVSSFSILTEAIFYCLSEKLNIFASWTWKFSVDPEYSLKEI